jgi:hypothetical protein
MDCRLVHTVVIRTRGNATKLQRDILSKQVRTPVDYPAARCCFTPCSPKTFRVQGVGHHHPHVALRKRHVCILAL